MMEIPDMTQTDPNETADRVDRLERIVRDLLAEATRQGASAAEAAASSEAGLEISVRLGEVETVEHTRDNGLGITVYFGQRKGSSSTSDLSPEAVRDAVSAACAIASRTQEDAYAGLAAADLMARDLPELDLYHPWSLEPDAAIQLAIACEDAARGCDPRIVNSEGASVSTQAGLHVYGNSHGFVAGYSSTRHGLSCAVVAQEGESMQRDYWWTTARAAADLESPQAVGRRAGERTLARLGARQIATRKVPVLFSPLTAAGLLRSLTGAISGSSLYRRSSFLLDRIDTRIFPDFVRIHERPHLRRGLGSAPFDGDGVATRAKDLVSEGILRTYLLDAYSARRLGLDHHRQCRGRPQSPHRARPPGSRRSAAGDGHRSLCHGTPGPRHQSRHRRLFPGGRRLLGRGRRDPVPGGGDHHRGQPQGDVPGPGGGG
jgi:PmbA protein